MRIALINEYYGNGSTGKLVKELADGLIQNGNEAIVYYSIGNGNKSKSKKIGNILFRKIHAVFSRISGLQGYFSIYSTKRFLKDLNNFNPDIIHLHNLHGNYINLGLLFDYIKKNDKPVIITLHDTWFYTGKCTHYVPANCEKWKTECNNCPLLHVDNTNPTFFFDTTRKCFNNKKNWLSSINRLGIIGVSEWVTNEVKQSFLGKIASIETINNWVNTNSFRPRSSNIKRDFGLVNKRIILMVSSSICLKKGYKELLFLAKNLKSNYKLVVIGKNDNNLFIPDNVLHIDRTSNQINLAEWYSAAEVCVNTTQYETFGMVTVESMACGTPVVVYKNTASQYLIPENCGIVINQDEGFEKILLAIYDIVEKDLKSKNNISEIIHEKYNFRDSLKEHLDFYKKIINGEQNG